jgi:hypothetical protein
VAGERKRVEEQARNDALEIVELCLLAGVPDEAGDLLSTSLSLKACANFFVKQSEFVSISGNAALVTCNSRSCSETKPMTKNGFDPSFEGTLRF